MPFDERYGNNAIALLGPELYAGYWVIGVYPEISTDSYDLDQGMMTVYKYDAGGSVTGKTIAEYWYGKSVAQYPTMYVTAVSSRLMAGNIWQVDLTLKGCISPKKARLIPTTSLKEMTVTRNGRTDGFNAVTPSFTLEYLQGPGVVITPPALPPAPPGFWFFGPAKTNQPSGWVQMEATSENIEGTPYTKATEKYQWIHAAEPASGS